MVVSVLESWLKPTKVNQNLNTCIIKAATNMVRGVQPQQRVFSLPSPISSSSSSPCVTVSLFQCCSLSSLSMASWDTFHFSGSWVSDADGRDTIPLQKSLHRAVSTSETNNSPILDFMKPETAVTLCTSSIPAGWDPEAALKLQLTAPAGRVLKRKSRASKRTQTTFIAADSEHFRQMVQQVTGVRIGDSALTLTAFLTSEPVRLDSRLTGGVCLPTLDTSAFLLNNPQNGMTESTGAASGSAGASPLSFRADVGPFGMDFDALSSFPTLES